LKIYEKKQLIYIRNTKKKDVKTSIVFTR